MATLTDIQIFPYEDGTFSANLAVNDKFLLQVGTDGRYSIPRSCEAVWSEDREQDMAYEELDADELAESLGLPVRPTIEQLEDAF